jgi:hypothetical protein
MVKNLLKLNCILLIFALLGCKKIEDSHALKHRSAEDGDYALASPSPLVQGNLSDQQRFVSEMGNYIREVRNSPHPSQAAYAMRSLFKDWEPTGKSFNELKSQLGEPSRIDGENVEYRLPDNSAGSTGGESFVFIVRNSRVIKYDFYSWQ